MTLSPFEGDIVSCLHGMLSTHPTLSIQSNLRRIWSPDETSTQTRVRRLHTLMSTSTMPMGVYVDPSAMVIVILGAGMSLRLNL
jgi:hypothetical protein